MSDTDILHAFYSYYTIGLILGVLHSVVFLVGRWHQKRYHPERRLFGYKQIFISSITMFLSWPVQGRVIVNIIGSPFDILKCELKRNPKHYEKKL